MSWYLMAPKIVGKKWIVVDDDVHRRLQTLGKKGETYNDIIRKLLDLKGSEKK